MEYNKALENYKKIVNELNEKIGEREKKIENIKSEIKDVKESRKQEIKKGIFTNSIKKFTKTNDITNKATEIEVLMCEIEALNELKNGESKDLVKAAKQLLKATTEEIKRIKEYRQAKVDETKKLQDKIGEIRKYLHSTDEAKDTTQKTINAMSELIRTRKPEEYQRYMEIRLDLLALAETVVEELE